MSKRRPSPWVPLSIYYYDDDKIMQAGEFAEVLFTRMMAYAGRHPSWDGVLPRLVVLTRLGVSALEGVPESAPESRLESLLESGLVTAQGPNIELAGWLNWNESGKQRVEAKAADRERKKPVTRGDADGTSDDALEDAPENAPENVPNSGAQDKSREDKSREEIVRAAPQPDDARPDVVALCLLLADRIEENGNKRPAVTKTWLTDCRLMLDRDERTVDDVRGAIQWSQAHHFWRANIMSMGKLRQQFDRLRMQAEQERQPARPRQQQETDDLFARAAERMGVTTNQKEIPA